MRRRPPKPVSFACAAYASTELYDLGIERGMRVATYDSIMGTVLEVMPKIWVRYDGDGLVYVKFELDAPNKHGEIKPLYAVLLKNIDPTFVLLPSTPHEDYFLTWHLRRMKAKLRAPFDGSCSRLEAWSRWINRSTSRRTSV